MTGGRRQGFQLAEILVGFALLVAIAIPLIAELFAGRRTRQDCRQRATARAIVSFLVHEALAGSHAALAQVRAVPASRLPELAAWAREHAPADHVERAWDGLTVTRAVVLVEGRRRVDVAVRWTGSGESRLTASVEVTP